MQVPVSLAALKNLTVSREFFQSEDGQDLLEYALLAALIALVAFGAVTRVGSTINTVLWTVISRGMGNSA